MCFRIDFILCLCFGSTCVRDTTCTDKNWCQVLHNGYNILTPCKRDSHVGLTLGNSEDLVHLHQSTTSLIIHTLDHIKEQFNLHHVSVLDFPESLMCRSKLFVAANLMDQHIQCHTSQISKRQLEHARFSGNPPTIRLTISHEPPSARDQIVHMETDCKLMQGFRTKRKGRILPKVCVRTAGLMSRPSILQVSINPSFVSMVYHTQSSESRYTQTILEAD